MRVAVVLVLVAGAMLLLRGVVAPLLRPARRERSPGIVCALCGSRQRAHVRMVAGKRAYVCEVCLRRGLELLDAPDEVTRFM